MDATPRQRRRSRGPRQYAGAGLLGAIGAIGAFTLALPTSPAHAGQFTISACHADRVNYSTRAFDDFATRGMIDALGQLDRQRTTVVLNKATASTSAKLPDRWLAIPNDERLALMLDSGTYSLEALDRGTRQAIKRLGLAIARQLV
jgi:hypothetical protein